MANDDRARGSDERDEEGRPIGSNIDRIEEFLEQQAALGLDATVNRRYLGMARELLSDSIPRRLDAATRREVESVLGVDTSGVRIHTGGKAQEAAAALGARAFALGDQDVFFGKGEFDTVTPQGKALIAHELTHVYEATMPVALATREDMNRSALRPGEDVAHHAEQQMYRQATTEAMAAAGEPQDLGPAEKAALEEKIWKILQERQRFGGDRFGRR